MEDLKRIAAESQKVSADDITSADLTIDVKIGQPARESLFTQLLPLLISVALMAGLWWLFMRQMQGEMCIRDRWRGSPWGAMAR